MASMKMYQDDDASTAPLSGKLIAVIGYGNQGSAQARCLRDSGFNVVVGVREGQSRKLAEEDRMTVMGIAEAAAKADIICMLVPDMAQREVYERFIERGLKPGKVLCFAHGLNITYGLIMPPRTVDVILIAPKSTGMTLREAYLHDEGVPALMAVHQNHSGRARETALAIAKAMRLTRKGVFECTFDQETYSNLFAEQCVTVGGQLSLLKAGFETMVKNGIPPEIAYFECVGVSKAILDLVEKDGLRKTIYGISRTASYGGLTRGKRVIGENARESMQKVFDEITDGKFAREWVAEYEGGMERFEELRKEESGHPLGETGERLRKTMGRSRKE